MEARRMGLFILITASFLTDPGGSMGASYRTPNFVVTAPTPSIARQVAKAAERSRRQLAIEWLGKAMPRWAKPCMVTVHVGKKLGAGGATNFLFENGEVFGWRMTIQGSLERILDSVLPHEITHTVFASHFREPLPRWADEGACTTVEHRSEREKQEKMLLSFLRARPSRGIPFSRMFSMKEYPRDFVPLYAQGYSLARFLINKGGKRKFLDYIGDGLKQNNWPSATKKHYGHSSLASLQNDWLDWVRRGSHEIVPSKNQSSPSGAIAKAPGKSKRIPRPEPNLIYQREKTSQRLKSLAAAGSMVPVCSRRKTIAKSVIAARSSPGWHPAGQGKVTRIDVTSLAKEAPAKLPLANRKESPLVEQNTARPQPPTQSRQIILEWSRAKTPSKLR